MDLIQQPAEAVFVYLSGFSNVVFQKRGGSLQNIPLATAWDRRTFKHGFCECRNSLQGLNTLVKSLLSL